MASLLKRLGARIRRTLDRADRRRAAATGTWGDRLGDASFLLCYHEVAPRESPLFAGQYMVVHPRRFADQMESLGRVYEFLSLRSFLERPGARRISVTFDDGLAGVYEHAFPVLRRLEVPFTIFINPPAIGNGTLLWPQQFAWIVNRDGGEILRRELGVDVDGEALRVWIRDRFDAAVPGALSRTLEAMGTSAARLAAETRPHLDAAQLDRMVASGLCTVGNHTATHPRLSRLAPEMQRREIETPAGDWVPFAYPFGAADSFDATTERLVRESGHACAVTTIPAPCDVGDRFALRRVTVPDVDGADLLGALQNASESMA